MWTRIGTWRHWRQPGLPPALRGIGFILRMFWAAAPGMAAAMVALTLLNGLMPALAAWLSKQVVDQVATTSRAPWVERAVLFLGLLYVAAQLVTSLLNPLLEAVNGLVTEYLLGHVNVLVMRKANRFPDLSRFEEARYYDDLQRIAREAGYLPMNVLYGVASLLQASVASAGLLLLIGRFHPLLPVVLVLTALPELRARYDVHRLTWNAEEEVSRLRRRLGYWSSLGTEVGPAREVRLYGLGDWLKERFQETFASLDRRLWGVRCVAAWRLTLYGLLRFAGAATLFLYIVRGGLAGRLTPGDLVLYLGAAFYLDSSLSSVTSFLTGTADLGRSSVKLADFLAATPAMPLPADGRRLPRPLTRGIEIRNLHFRYPGTEQEVLRGLTLTIRPGESVALVGANGSGKTTLVKLLTRLYDPTEGAIFLDGADLREYDLPTLRRRMAVIFQDFSQYMLTLGENIALGAVELLGDAGCGTPDAERVLAARVEAVARSGGAAALAERLPDGFAAGLGRPFGGTDLSGGEWQRVALSRAFMREADVLILDEPTAALDVRTEYEVYRRFAELTRGKTTLLISHRFSTVRMAGRILVIEDGHLVEEGSHDELMRRGRRYAELFLLQAEGFRDGPPERSEAVEE
jgi:ATP-binding cassette subfamily B protein